MKLNETAPEQHMAILAIAGIAIFLSVLDTVKGAFRDDPNAVVVDMPEDGSRFHNPQLAWYERIFCRGYQRAGFCSYRLIHPFVSVLEENDVKAVEGAPKKIGVTSYRGRLPTPGINGKSVITEGNWKSGDEFFKGVNSPD